MALQHVHYRHGFSYLARIRFLGSKPADQWSTGCLICPMSLAGQLLPAMAVRLLVIKHSRNAVRDAGTPR